MTEAIHSLKAILQSSRKIVVFTGAGISCPSGIPDFRSAKGLYHQASGYTVPPEEMISHSFFERDPETFFAFYRSKMVYPDARPNSAHRFFAALEQAGKEVCVVTQNIDGLHQAAGSRRVYEIHGSVWRNHCVGCGRFFDGHDLPAQPTVPHCPECGSIIKPDVVLYEEPLDEAVVSQAVEAIAAADTLLIIGTSLAVYPAASYVRYFRGPHLIIVNKEATGADARAELVLHEDVAAVADALGAPGE